MLLRRPVALVLVLLLLALLGGATRRSRLRSRLLATGQCVQGKYSTIACESECLPVVTVLFVGAPIQ